MNTNPPRVPKGQTPKVGNVRVVPMDQVKVPTGKKKNAVPATPPTSPAPAPSDQPKA